MFGGAALDAAGLVLVTLVVVGAWVGWCVASLLVLALREVVVAVLIADL